MLPNTVNQGGAPVPTSSTANLTNTNSTSPNSVFAGRNVAAQEQSMGLYRDEADGNLSSVSFPPVVFPVPDKYKKATTTTFTEYDIYRRIINHLAPSDLQKLGEALLTDLRFTRAFEATKDAFIKRHCWAIDRSEYDADLPANTRFRPLFRASGSGSWLDWVSGYVIVGTHQPDDGLAYSTDSRTIEKLFSYSRGRQSDGTEWSHLFGELKDGTPFHFHRTWNSALKIPSGVIVIAPNWGELLDQVADINLLTFVYNMSEKNSDELMKKLCPDNIGELAKKVTDPDDNDKPKLLDWAKDNPAAMDTLRENLTKLLS